MFEWPLKTGLTVHQSSSTLKLSIEILKAIRHHGDMTEKSVVKINPKIFWFFFFFSSPEPKAHGELIGYSWSGVRPSSSVVVVRRPSLTISNFFFSETAWPIKAKFYVEPPWVGGTKVCSRHLIHMTKMAATPIYGINPSKIFFSRTGRPIFTKLGM